LNPAKRKELSLLTAKKLDRNFQEVDDIVAFFYRYVQKRLSSVESIAVNVPNLGTFVLKKRRVLKKIERHKNFIDSLDETASIKAFEIKQEVKKDIEKYEAILDMMNQEEERKLKVQTLKEKHHANQIVEGSQ
jgi:nucleoid DNA-binding protein